MEEKLPLYDYLNVLLPGLTFFGCCIAIFPEQTVALLNSDPVKNLGTGPEILVTTCAFAVVYEAGLIIERIGSALEGPMIKCKLLYFNNDYLLYNEKKKEHPIMSTLALRYGNSRTKFALFLLLLILSFFNFSWGVALVFLALTALYAFAARKFSKKITDLMKAPEANAQQPKENS